MTTTPELVVPSRNRLGAAARRRPSVVAGVTALARRPVLATLCVSVPFVLGQAWWIATKRDLGAFNVDEAGGLAAALRFRRSLNLGFGELVHAVSATRNGPVVPLLSLPLLSIGPKTAATAMMVQPLFIVASACAAAGMVAVTGRRAAATVTGIVVLLLPVSVVSSRSYQYSAGVGAFMALGMWALLASRRGRSTAKMLAFGVCVGLMTLCRTMSIGFVPGLAIAAAIIVARERRAVLNLLLAGLAGLAVAGPWWVAEWRNIVDYLSLNAYGDRAHYWGEVALSGRVRGHLTYFVGDFRALVWIGLIIVVSIVATSPARAWFHRNGPASRELAAVVVVALFGFAALLSTSNTGYWFAHPLDVLVVVAAALAVIRWSGISGRGPRRLPFPIEAGLVVGPLAARVPLSRPILAGLAIVVIAILWRRGSGALLSARWALAVPGAAFVGALMSFRFYGFQVILLALALGRVSAMVPSAVDRWPRLVGGAALVAVVLGFALSFSLGPAGALAGSDLRGAVVADHSLLQSGNIGADHRLSSTDAAVRQRAADEWLHSSIQVAELMERYKRDNVSVVQTVTGEIHLFNVNTLGLTEEVIGQGITSVEGVNTLEPPASTLRKSLTARAEGFPRVLIVIRGRSLAFPDGRGRVRFLRLALERGWKIAHQVPLPDGGDVLICTHPDSIAKP